MSGNKYVFDNIDETYNPRRLGAFQSDLIKMMDRCRRDGAISDSRHKNIIDALARWDDDREAILQVAMGALKYGFTNPKDAGDVYENLRNVFGDDRLLEELHNDVDSLIQNEKEHLDNTLDGLRNVMNYIENRRDKL